MVSPAVAQPAGKTIWLRPPASGSSPWKTVPWLSSLSWFCRTSTSPDTASTSTTYDALEARSAWTCQAGRGPSAVPTVTSSAATGAPS